MKSMRACLVSAVIAGCIPLVTVRAAGDQHPVDLDRRVSIDVNAVAPVKVLGMLAETLGRELVLDGKFQHDITLVASNIRAETALNAVCESAGCRWWIDGGQLRVSVAEPPSEQGSAGAQSSRTGKRRVYDQGEQGVVLPKAIRVPRPPQYTREALQEKVQGVVTLSVVVEPDGSIGEVAVLTPLEPGLDAQAVSWARQWRFTAGTKDGQPVAVRVKIDMQFTVR